MRRHPSSAKHARVDGHLGDASDEEVANALLRRSNEQGRGARFAPGSSTISSLDFQQSRIDQRVFHARMAGHQNSGDRKIMGKGSPGRQRGTARRLPVG